jgi:hypothetical protein
VALRPRARAGGRLTFPRKSGHRVTRISLCLLWGDVADGGVDAPPIVIAFDIGEQVAPRGIAIGVFAVVDEPVFRVPKKLSTGALSQQFPLRLIDWMLAAACRMSR